MAALIGRESQVGEPPLWVFWITPGRPLMFLERFQDLRNSEDGAFKSRVEPGESKHRVVATDKVGPQKVGLQLRNAQLRWAQQDRGLLNSHSPAGLLHHKPSRQREALGAVRLGRVGTGNTGPPKWICDCVPSPHREQTRAARP